MQFTKKIQKHVLIVIRNSVDQFIYVIISEPILEKNHFPAISVTKDLLQKEIWYNTEKYVISLICLLSCSFVCRKYFIFKKYTLRKTASVFILVFNSDFYTQTQQPIYIITCDIHRDILEQTQD